MSGEAFKLKLLARLQCQWGSESLRYWLLSLFLQESTWFL